MYGQLQRDVHIRYVRVRGRCGAIAKFRIRVAI